VIDEQTKRPNTFWRELPVLLGVAIIVAVVVRAFVLQTFYIPSESMESTLLIRDRVLVNKLVYDFRSPHRGEVIVFEAPDSWRNDPSEEDFIKRVIGTGGDHVVCCDDKQRITVNGKALDETYIYADENGLRDLPSEEQFDVTVPPGRLWVMGDHRSRSGDSRYNFLRNNKDPMQATISEDDVVGRAFVVFWPFSRAKWLSAPEAFDKVPAPTAK
jgi:signal peptidase I